MAKKTAKKKTAKKETKRKRPGQPTKYKPEYTEQAYKICLLGSTDEQMADFFGVAVSTINKWKLDYKPFSESIKRGKLSADANVAESLYERARGYSHPDTHISNYQGEITQTEITKHYPPDTGAAFIWLKNRAGWKDRQSLDIGVDQNTITLLRLIDGSTKGQLPSRTEEEDAG